MGTSSRPKSRDSQWAIVPTATNVVVKCLDITAISLGADTFILQALTSGFTKSDCLGSSVGIFI